MADRRLQVFHAVAKQLSFTKAADVLFMTQPAVTFQIKQLEEQFNSRLFDRGHGRIALTPAGELVLEYAERILGLSAEMEVRLTEMTGEIGGPLLVGASTSIAEFMLPCILGEFKARHPAVLPHLILANSESVESRVAEHLLDIGLIDAPSHQPNLHAEYCCEDELQVVCSPDFPWAGHQELTPQQLMEQPFIGREPGSGTRETTDAYLHQAGINYDSLKLVMELTCPNVLNGVVETGLGFAIASRTAIAKSLRLGDLVAIPLRPRLTRTLSMVYPKEKFRSKLVATFIEFAAARLKQLVAGQTVQHLVASAARRYAP